MKPEDVPDEWVIEVACELPLDRAPTFAELHRALANVTRLIAAAEREACARLCDDLRHPDYSSETNDWLAGTAACAAAIRARGDAQS